MMRKIVVSKRGESALGRGGPTTPSPLAPPSFLLSPFFAPKAKPNCPKCSKALTSRNVTTDTQCYYCGQYVYILSCPPNYPSSSAKRISQPLPLAIAGRQNQSRWTDLQEKAEALVPNNNFGAVLFRNRKGCVEVM